MCQVHKYVTGKVQHLPSSSSRCHHLCSRGLNVIVWMFFNNEEITKTFRLSHQRAGSGSFFQKSASFVALQHHISFNNFQRSIRMVCLKWVLITDLIQRNKQNHRNYTHSQVYKKAYSAPQKLVLTLTQKRLGAHLLFITHAVLVVLFTQEAHQ